MRRTASASELLAWTLVGAAIGVVAGFALGEWLGPLTVDRAKPLLDRMRQGSEDSGRLGAAEAARAARRTLASDPDLKGLGLEPIAVGPGVVELHGWVPSRALRARAARLVAGTAGIDSLVNCVLVHGEDDAPGSLRAATDQPA
ncbi:MAG TPA: BON domain-containing protein [Gemmatimonadales bacterium]|jgi:hypothetical protein